MSNATGKDKQRYRCIHPRCTYTVPNRSYLMGKQAECPECHKAFVIDNDVLRRVTLRCQVCIGTKERTSTVDEMRDIEAVLKEALLDKAVQDLERM